MGCKMITEYIIETAREIGTLRRYDSAYYNVKRMPMIIEGMSSRKTLERRAAEEDARSYREILVEVAK